MNVFVTGGAGYIGSITTTLLLDNGHTVTVFDNLETGHLEAIDPRANFIHGDLRKQNDIIGALAIVRPQAILHFAAYALVGESMQKPELYWNNNVNGGMNLINAAIEHDISKFVFSSSCATYGTPDNLPITEDTPQRPENPYGESKLMIEKALRWMEECHGLPSICLRYFNACGATSELGEDHAVETHLIPNVLKAAAGKQDQINIFGTDFPTLDGTCVRDYIHVRDLAIAHLLALESGCSGAYNLGTGRGYSVHKVIEAARRITRKTIPVIEQQRRPGDPAALVASAAKAERELGWRPQYSDLDTIINDAWQWYIVHPEGYSTRSLACAC